MVRQAKSLDVLLAEVNEHAPGRYKASDGGLGDPAHASRVSDHNPNAAGVWRARDITNDPDDHDGNPANDLPGQDLANRVSAKLGKHPALKSGAYVIFNRRIISFDRLEEGWRPYDGVNAHQKHVHVSVSTAARGYDSTKPWDLWPSKVNKIPAILADLREVAAKHEVSLVYIARVALYGAKSAGRRLVAVLTARAILKPWK